MTTPKQSPGRSRILQPIDAKPSKGGGEVKSYGLVRYPKASNGLRALLDGPASTSFRLKVPITTKLETRIGKPGASERSKPSATALRLLREVVPSTVEAKDSGFAHVLPRIEPLVVSAPSKVGQMVRLRRLMLQMSQGELSNRAGVGRRFISDLEAGKATVELGKTLAVCRALKLTLTLKADDGG